MKLLPLKPPLYIRLCRLRRFVTFFLFLIQISFADVTTLPRCVLHRGLLLILARIASISFFIPCMCIFLHPFGWNVIVSLQSVLNYV